MYNMHPKNGFIINSITLSSIAKATCHLHLGVLPKARSNCCTSQTAVWQLLSLEGIRSTDVKSTFCF